jgi:hypothetical protein
VKLCYYLNMAEAQGDEQATSKRSLVIAITVFVLCGLAVLFIFIHQSGILKGVFKAGGTVYYVSPAGNDNQSGKDAKKPLRSIQKAVHRAQPGDTVQLADGDYPQSFETERSGRKGMPITIEGARAAVLYGSTAHVIDIHHSYITLSGFTVNGKYAQPDTEDSYRDKLIYAIGQGNKTGVEYMTIDNMLIENSGGECVRMRYFAKHNDIKNSTIRNCGVFDFMFKDGGKNGEGVYIGTAPEQRKDHKNPTADPDVSRDNHIHHNTIETNGNECVDIKEAATDNLVEYNTCTKQTDPESGGFDARGTRNTFRYNTVTDTVGAGVRLGGDSEYDGTDNDVYGNTFARNQGGVLNIQRLPQGKICNNTVDSSTSVRSADNAIDPRTACE